MDKLEQVISDCVRTAVYGLVTSDCDRTAVYGLVTSDCVRTAVYGLVTSDTGDRSCRQINEENAILSN